jgi:peptidoglycan/xylan/chitin deacetylase (PgdA/CDA1 family)
MPTDDGTEVRMGALVVNVCFHGIGTPGRELEPGEADYWVERRRFLEVLDEVATWPAVRLSFDDGNASDVEIALPALVERGLRADFFVLAGRLDAAGSLGEDAVRELLRQGMGIGSHGMRHRSWRGMDPATRREELVEARERLAAVVGRPVDTAACPLGRYDRRVLADLRRLGYARVYTSDRRHARPEAWLQPRHSVRAGDSAASLRASALGRPGLRQRVRGSAVGLAKRLR